MCKIGSLNTNDKSPKILKYVVTYQIQNKTFRIHRSKTRGRYTERYRQNSKSNISPKARHGSNTAQRTKLIKISAHIKRKPFFMKQLKVWHIANSFIEPLGILGFWSAIFGSRKLHYMWMDFANGRPKTGEYSVVMFSMNSCWSFH